VKFQIMKLVGPLPLPRTDEQRASQALRTYTLLRAGLVPRGGSGLGLLHLLGPLPVFFSAADYRSTRFPASYASKPNSRARPIDAILDHD